MSEVVIRVEGLSKKYRLGSIGTGTLRHDLNQWWAKVRGKEDPFEPVDFEGNIKRDKDEFWALKDLSFEVNQGDILGIIGKNGAGKSTLLKILSRVTTPTFGEIKVKGRIASLLEVGTGFHPELTGRENIFLNGAIMGMTKREIKSKLDEIIDFSGVEKHIDTPVKRYSSGMYVRLAFAVAAHLDPEILIVDEVLAVGDADFQKKCLGKMRDVSQQDGRTILFVSHNLLAVKNLCKKAIWLDQGKIITSGDVSTVINSYSSNNKIMNWKKEWNTVEEAPGNKWTRIKRVELVPQFNYPNEPFDIRIPFDVKFQIWNLQDNVKLEVDLALFSYEGECIFIVSSPSSIYKKGIINGEFQIPGNLLNDGAYFINMYIVKDTTTILFEFEECLSFDLEDFRGDLQWYGKWIGAIRPKIPILIAQKNNIDPLSDN